MSTSAPTTPSPPNPSLPPLAPTPDPLATTIHHLTLNQASLTKKLEEVTAHLSSLTQPTTSSTLLNPHPSSTLNPILHQPTSFNSLPSSSFVFSPPYSSSHHFSPSPNSHQSPSLSPYQSHFLSSFPSFTPIFPSTPLPTSTLSSQSTPSFPSFSTFPHQPQNPPNIKLNIPCFDGTDPLGWLFKINQFFDFHNTPHHHRLTITSFYMDRDALSWFQWMHINDQLLTWPQFTHALQARFAPSEYEDPAGALFKLTQSTTVRDYQCKFEAVANRVHRLLPAHFLSCFISGLKPEIRREVQALRPTTLPQAIGLALLQEDKVNDVSAHRRLPAPAHWPTQITKTPTLTATAP